LASALLMNAKPKRGRVDPPAPHSPTRFLIPMIDVLLMLFGLFMVAQVMRTEDAANARGENQKTQTLEPQREKDNAEELRKKLAELTIQLGKERESLRNASAAQLAGMISVRSMEIDPLDGHLKTDAGETIRNEVQARSLIDLDRRRQVVPSGEAEKKLVYLLRYPKARESGFPTIRQKQDLGRWFSGTVVTYEIPDMPASQQNEPNKNGSRGNK